MSESSNIASETDAEEARSAADMSWTETVQDFERAATWLTGADRPQLKALYAIAKQLDGGTFQTAMISQFTLVQRQLQARRPAAPDAAPISEADEIIAAMEKNPGAFWRAPS